MTAQADEAQPHRDVSSAVRETNDRKPEKAAAGGWLAGGGRKSDVSGEREWELAGQTIL